MKNKMIKNIELTKRQLTKKEYVSLLKDRGLTYSDIKIAWMNVSRKRNKAS